MNIERNMEMNTKNWIRHIIIFLALTSIVGVMTYALIPTCWILITLGVGTTYILVNFEVMYRKKKKEYFEQWKKEGLI